MRRLAVPLALAVTTLAGVLVAVGRASFGPPPAPTTNVALATPVLSVRRIAPALLAARGEAKLQTALDATLGDPALAPARSCLVVKSGNRLLYSVHPTDAFLPASTLKVLTATAALTALGPEARFTTEVRAGAPPAGGVVNGNLWLVGGGDPVLETRTYNESLRDQKDVFTALDALADAVASSGVKVVNGSVLADEGRYDTQRYLPTWKPTYATDGEVGPLSAVLVNDGMNPPPKAVPSPPTFAAATLTDLLKARGIQVSGAPGPGGAPGSAVKVASVQSPPLTDVVGEMLRQSDNTTAELLTKEMGHVAANGQGTTRNGTAAMRVALARAGVDVTGLDNNDGSGLDRGDRATCQLLVTAVSVAGRQSALANAMAVAAVSGTLQKRFVGSPAAQRLRAKTGSLDGVSALTGWVDPRPGGATPPLAFAFVANGLPRDALGVAAGDRIGSILASYPDEPPVAQVLPLPAVPAA